MRLMLACNAGMSTSMVVAQMDESALRQGKNYIIWAVDIDSVEDEIGNFDVLLIGPQIQYKLRTLKRLLEDQAPVDIIDPVAYGCCDGQKVLQQAEKLLNDFHERRNRV